MTTRKRCPLQVESPSHHASFGLVSSGGGPGSQVGDQGRAADHRGISHRRRSRLARTPWGSVPGHGALPPAGYAANLVDSWLPALDGVTAKLTAGASVADVGERCRFEVARVAAYPGTNYDLVALFDCLHDMGDPVGAAKHVRQSLAPDGTWLLVEPFAGDRVEDNLNPVGRIFYNASTMICVPASLSQEVGLGLGAQAGEAALRDVATAAGFSSFRRATETPFNIVLEARP